MKKKFIPQLERLEQNQVAASSLPFETQKGAIHKMSGELANYDYQEDNLVKLYQDIMQCEEDHAKSVYLVLIDVVII